MNIRWNPTCVVKKVKHNVYRRNVCLYFHHHFISVFHVMFHICVRCDMTFIEPMHRNKPNTSYLLHFNFIWILSTLRYQLDSIATTPMFQPCVLIKLSKNKHKAVTTAAKRCCNTSSESHLKLKSYETSSDHYTNFGCPIASAFCTEHDSVTAMICAKSQNHFAAKKYVIGKRDLQYIPRNMHTVLLCFALLWLCNRS